VKLQARWAKEDKERTRRDAKEEEAEERELKRLLKDLATFKVSKDDGNRQICLLIIRFSTTSQFVTANYPCEIPFSALPCIGVDDDEKRSLDAEYARLEAEECELRRVFAAAGVDDDSEDEAYANAEGHTEEEEMVALALLQDKWAREDECFAVEMGLLDPSELTAEQGRGVEEDEEGERMLTDLERLIIDAEVARDRERDGTTKLSKEETAATHSLDDEYFELLQEQASIKAGIAWQEEEAELMVVADDGEDPYTEEELMIARALLQARWDAEDAVQEDFSKKEGNALVSVFMNGDEVREEEEEEEVMVARMAINQEYADLEAEEAELRLLLEQDPEGAFAAAQAHDGEKAVIIPQPYSTFCPHNCSYVFSSHLPCLIAGETTDGAATGEGTFAFCLLTSASICYAR
jgi:hypothetical protein